MRVVTAVCLSVLVVAALCYCGCAPKPAAAPDTGIPGLPGPAAKSGLALGEKICKDGIGESGQHIAFTGGSDRFKSQPGGCLGCHAEDGRGRNLPNGKIPPINYSALREGDKPRYATDEALVKAIREGNPAWIQSLAGMMPRWALSPAEGTAMVEYLKVLDKAPPAPAEPAAKPAGSAAPSKG